MLPELTARAETLESAFTTFNTLSIQLADSYRALEHQVALLTSELNEARNERLVELLEKERLACRITQLLDLLPGGIVVLDEQGLITECNPAAVKLLGEPLLGEQWHQVIQRAFSPEIDKGSEVNLKNGKRVSITSQSLGHEPGQIVLVTDVTEQHALQSLLNRHYKLSAMGEMAASLAHQIRTPLATALLYMSHLSRPVLSDEDRGRTLEKVVSRLRYLDHMVNDMLQYARSGTFEMDCILLKNIFDGLVATVEPQLSSQNGTLSIRVNAKNIYIYGNADALLGALLNIVTNAIQVTGKGVHIDICVSKFGHNKTRITISDNGPGIEEDVLAQLFTPFFTTRANGTGLGLAIAHTIIDAHKGVIKAVSKPGQGASFIIELPRANERELLTSAVRTSDEVTIGVSVKNQPAHCIETRG